MASFLNMGYMYQTAHNTNTGQLSDDSFISTVISPRYNAYSIQINATFHLDIF